MTSGSGFSGFGAAIQKWVDNKINGVDNALAATVEHVAEFGENKTKEFIETRGTAKSGKRGRIETGEMRDSVKSGTVKKGRNHHQAEFGWMSHSPSWAKYQEQGFTHVGGSPVEGMFALGDAGDLAVKEAQRKLKEELDGI